MAFEEHTRSSVQVAPAGRCVQEAGFAQEFSRTDTFLVLMERDVLGGDLRGHAELRTRWYLY